jgi:SAM-dependent methyltransferase
MNETHETNRACWNAMADGWRRMADERGTWRECHRNPSLVLSPGELHFLRDVQGKDVTVLGSGDNEVVLALAGMGARVTSVDISEGQLQAAGERAKTLGLDIRFVRADVTDLAEIPSASVDVVYTGGHVAVWVSDIRRFHAEAARILRPNGLFVINEYHPIRQMWHESEGPAPRNRYFNRGPYEYLSNEGLPQVEFHWTVSDQIQSVIDAGCSMVHVSEWGESEGKADYDKWMPATLPNYLLIVGRKER